MLLDLIDTNNYASYNIKLAQKVGLEAAVYCNQLLTIQNKAQRKLKTIQDGGEYFRVDRDFILRQTMLSAERQMQLDSKLAELGVLKCHPTNVDFLWVNVELLGALIAEESVDLQQSLNQVFVSDRQTKREAKQQAIKNKLLNEYTQCPVEMRVALGNWIDAVNQNPKVPPVNKMTLRQFYTDINSYVKGENLDLALWIINTSAAYGWRDARWAIERYQKQQSEKSVQYKARNVSSEGEVVY